MYLVPTAVRRPGVAKLERSLSSVSYHVIQETEKVLCSLHGYKTKINEITKVM